VAAVALLLGAACRQDMFNQPKARTYRAGEFFDDGASARVPVPGTVARGQLRADPVLHTGVGPDGRFVARLPLPLDRALLLRGRERFEIFCSPCHGRTGDGRGMIVQRGFKEPTSFHADRLRQQPIGYFFDVMTNGFGQMSDYSAQVPVRDRWAIAAYLRALQLSQHAPIAEVPEGDRERIERSGGRSGAAR
jgi:cbb3-type cytochrome c oxidase subunit III